MKISKNTALDLVLLLTLAIIPFVFYGQQLIMFNQAEIFLGPTDVLTRWSFTWDARAGLGGDVGYAMGGAFPLATFFAFFSFLGIPLFVTNELWFALLLFFSGVSMYFLISVITPKPARFAKIVPAIAYMCSPYVIITLNGTSQFLPFYATLPAMLGIYIRSLNGHLNIKSALALAFVSSFMSGINPTLILMNFLVIGLFFLFYLLTNRLQNLKKTIVFHVSAIIAYFGLNLYWFYPMIRYNYTAWMAPVFSEPLSMHNASSSFLEIFRTLGYWGFYSGYNGQPYFTFSTAYINNPLLIVTTLLLPVVACLALLSKTKNKYILFFGILLLLFIPMAVATYPVQNPSLTGQIYRWAYDNVPYFNVFRNNYKFVGLISLCYCALLSKTVQDICISTSKFSNKSILHLKKIKVKHVLVISIIAILFINGWPLYTGNEFSGALLTKEIPQYWYDASNWLNSIPGDGGLFILPEQYGSVYTWGQSTGNINVPLFTRPQIFQQMGVGATTEYSANMLSLAYNAFKTNSTNFCKILGLLGVEYVLQRNDVDWQYYGVDSPTKIKVMLENQEGLSYVCSFGELDFYKNNYYVPTVYAAHDLTYINSKNISTTLNTLNLLRTEDSSTLNSSAIFFSSIPGNNQTIAYTDRTINEIDNFAFSPTNFTNSFLGKFFKQDAEGTITELKLYVKNNDVSHASSINIGFSEAPGSKQIFSVNVTIPAGFTGWLYREIDYPWNYASIFIYSTSCSYAQIGYDFSEPYDCYRFNNLQWSDTPARCYFGLEYSSTSKINNYSNNSLTEFPIITYSDINPTELKIDILSKDAFFLIFSQSYSSDWEAYKDGEEISLHTIANGYANCWFINFTGQFTITLKYAPQATYDIAKIISYSSIVVISLFIVIPIFLKEWRYRMHNSREHNNVTCNR